MPPDPTEAPPVLGPRDNFGLARQRSYCFDFTKRLVVWYDGTNDARTYFRCRFQSFAVGYREYVGLQTALECRGFFVRRSDLF